MLEIERKYLLEQLPAGLAPAERQHVEQFYLATGHEELRVRRACLLTGEESCVLTLKRGVGMVRYHAEWEISAETYDQLSATAGHLLSKTRLIYRVDGADVIVDVFDSPAGLITAEVEFADEKAAQLFVPPPWFGREVSANPSFSNQRLWLNLKHAK